MLDSPSIAKIRELVCNALRNRRRGEILASTVLFVAGAALAVLVGLKFLPSAGAQTPQNDLPTPQNPIVAKIIDPDNAPTNIEPLIIVSNSQLHVSVPEPTSSFRPGKYKLELWIWRNGAIYYTENDFTWGVLAVNFNKSMYALGDKAKIGFAVLDDTGRTICGADISMDITSPSGSVSHFGTQNKTIKRNSTCGPQTVTNNPDYSASFVANETGIYTVSVAAATVNGTRQITDSFAVQNPPMFDVARSAPTRIYPPATYDVSLDVKANEDFLGTITETVPASFAVAAGGAQKTFTHLPAQAGDTQTITWPVNLKNGATTTLTYAFKAPDVSPELYKLGPLQIGNWSEARQWQVAADAANITLVATSSVSGCATGSTASTTITCVHGLPLKVGDSLVMIISTKGSSTAEVSSISGANPAWSKNISVATSTGSTANSTDIWSSVNIVNASATMTVTLANRLVGAVKIAEYSGIVGTGAADVNATTTGPASNPAKTGTTATTNQAKELWIAGVTDVDARRTFSASTGGFTLEATTSTGSTTGGLNIALLDKIVSATGVASSSLTMSTAVINSGAIQTFKALPTITLANGTEPVGVTVNPGANATTSAVFTFVTDIGTSTITNVTTTVSTSSGVYQIQITDSVGTTVFGSSTNPSSVTNAITLSTMNVSTTATTFLIMIKPLNATSMPAVPGNTYIVTSTLTAWTDSKNLLQGGSNTTSSPVTIDNQSPANVTNASGSAGNTQVTLSWTNPLDSDFATTTVLRATSSITVAPTEGTYYAVGAFNTSTTVACVTSSTASSCIDSGLTNGTAYYYEIFTADNFLNYSAGAFQGTLPVTPSANSPPTVSAVSLNHGNPITLTPNATTSFDINYTVTDTNGCTDIVNTTSTAFRGGVSSTCAVGNPTTNNLNCYLFLTHTTSSCSGNAFNSTDTVGIYYFAQSTGNNSSSFSSDHWYAYASAIDSANTTGTATSSAVDVNVLLALSIAPSSIDYGTVPASSTTGSVNQTTTIQNVGNASQTLKIYGTALALSGNSIATSSQHYATSSFTFGGFEQILNEVALAVPGFLLTTPTSTNAVSSPIYWGLTVPAGNPTGTYSGVNTFTAIFSP